MSEHRRVGLAVVLIVTPITLVMLFVGWLALGHFVRHDECKGYDENRSYIACMEDPAIPPASKR